MTFEAFRAAVESMVEDIPEEFLQGLQGVHVMEEAVPEEDFEEVYRLGEYLDPGTPNFLGGQAGLGRHIALYYGSFVAVADDDFDWEAEIWETLTHELRHHVESLAGEDSLVQDDIEKQLRFERRPR
ncbi:MAG: metallopeptidase family protein [Deinococcales bacterium]